MLGSFEGVTKRKDRYHVSEEARTTLFESCTGAGVEYAESSQDNQ